jgi:hypothetical protein
MEVLRWLPTKLRAIMRVKARFANEPSFGPSYRARIAGPSETKALASSWIKRKALETSKASGENNEELARTVIGHS